MPLEMPPDAPNRPQAFQLNVELVDSEPVVWRRVLVPIDISLSTLHEIIQRAMGWENLHPYNFHIGLGADKQTCEVSTGFADVLSQLGEKPLYYNYDPNCGWLHRVQPEALSVQLAPESAIEKSENPVRSRVLPTCLEGANACPPEGTEGVWGYDEFLARLENPDDPDYLSLIDRFGDFDPDSFDLEGAIARVEKHPITIISAQ